MDQTNSSQANSNWTWTKFPNQRDMEQNDPDQTDLGRNNTAQIGIN